MRMLLLILFMFCIFTVDKIVIAQEDEAAVDEEGVGFGNLDDLDAVEDALDQVGSEAPEPQEEPEFEEASELDEGDFDQSPDMNEDDFEGNSGDEDDFEDDGGFEDDADFEGEGGFNEQSVDVGSDLGSSGDDTVDITDVQFDGNENGGTIIITTSDEAFYSTRRTNSGKQIVLEIGNARLPDRFKRPYDTKEFTSNIGFFQGYQASGSTVARFVIQLREDTAPGITQSGNRILIAAQGGNNNMEDELSDEVSEEEVSAQEKGFDDSALMQDPREGAITQFYGHLISIELRDSPLIDAIRLIIEESGSNILMSNIPAKNITLKLRNVPWDQALSILMESNGLGYTRQGEVMIIRPLADMQKDVQDQANFKKQQADAKKQQALAEKQLEDLGPVEEDVIPIFNSEAGKVMSVVSGLNVLTDQGSIQVLEDNNSLLVKDSVKKITELRALIKEKIDKPALQVLIEAKIIEATEDFERAFGLDMSTPELVPNVPTATDQATPDTPAPVAPFGTNVSRFASPFSGPEGAGITLRLSNIPAIALGDLTARLQLVEIKGMVKILASPRVVTLNNKSATISQTTTIRTAKTSTNTETNTQQTDFDYRDLPLSLNVTPIISADGVTMKVTLQRKFSTGGNGTELSRDINTEVFVRHGDTTVIGGVYTSDLSVTESGIPFLMRIPLLGNLFKRKSRNTSKNELMIFLTPTIINRDVSVGLTLNSVGEEALENTEEFSEEFSDDLDDGFSDDI